MGTLPKVT